MSKTSKKCQYLSKTCKIFQNRSKNSKNHLKPHNRLEARSSKHVLSNAEWIRKYEKQSQFYDDKLVGHSYSMATSVRGVIFLITNFRPETDNSVSPSPGRVKVFRALTGSENSRVASMDSSLKFSTTRPCSPIRYRATLLGASNVRPNGARSLFRMGLICSRVNSSRLRGLPSARLSGPACHLRVASSQRVTSSADSRPCRVVDHCTTGDGAGNENATYGWVEQGEGGHHDHRGSPARHADRRTPGLPGGRRTTAGSNQNLTTVNNSRTFAICILRFIGRTREMRRDRKSEFVNLH